MGRGAPLRRDVHGGAGADVFARRAGQHLIRARLDAPTARPHVVKGKRARRQVKRDRARFAARDANLLERAQLDGRAEDARLPRRRAGRRHIDLNHLGAVARARVAHSDGRLVQLEGAVLKRGVRKAVPKRKERSDAVCAEVPVAHVEPLSVREPARVVGEVLVRGAVSRRVREGLGKLARRADRAEEHVGKRGPAALPGQLRLHARHGGDERVHLHGQTHVLAVEALALVLVGQPRHDDGDIASFGHLDGLLDQWWIALSVRRVEALAEPELAAGALDDGPDRIHRDVQVVRVDLG
eukprot:scaffold11973_cov112-Isochrysis_galbana.AAC.2